ncbi:Natural resistance-associated macrophage protein 2 [Trichostrongylus colubriformis]|uniref:Natural resistance-associated macrophage protein 2 n=1 Tax=Trichostrongylus colubriformis TaxID=6319 RepID=A0AAN8EMV9_TRICO
MAEIAHSYYPKWPRLILWIMVEIAIIASDMQEVIGTAISLYLLSDGNIPLWAGVLITICDTFTFLFLERYGVRKFEAFFAILIACMAASFGFEFAESKPDLGSMFTGMVLPWCKNCDTTQFLQGVSIVGAVIMPHNLYLHSALVKSRMVDRSRESKVKEANKYYFIESFFALFCSFWINVLVVAVFAQGMYGKTNADVKHNCDTLDNHMPGFYMNVFENNTDIAEVDIFHAGVFLGCTFGVGALYVWAIGILAAGQSSTMTGTYAGQFAMEGFVQIKLPQWKRILVTRSLAMAPTLLVTIFSGGIQHITGLNDFLNCVQMVQLPFAIIPVLTFVSDERVMFNFKTSRCQKAFALTVSLVILAINFFFLYEWVETTFGFDPASISIAVVLLVLYVVAIVYLFYYCLVAMGLLRRFEWAYLPEPQYQDFDAPWLISGNKTGQAESHVNAICYGEDDEKQSIKKIAL